MKLNWAERLAVNNPIRTVQQRWEIRWMRRRRALGCGAVALEMGCGRGVGARLILEVFEPETLFVSDLDLRMVRKAGRALSKAGTRAGLLYAADASRIPQPDATVDGLFGFGVLHHVPDWRCALREAARVLKPGGLYFFEEIYPTLYQNALTGRILLHPKTDRFEGRELREALVQAGLRLLETLEIRGIGILGIAERVP